MNATCVTRTVFAGALACLLVTAACGRGGASSPSAPSRPASASSSLASAITIGQSASWSIFGGSSADLAACLHASTDPACFSGARLSALTIGGAAATAPGAPVGFSSTASGSTVTLTWTAPSSGDPVTTYVIEAGSSSGAANLANFATNSTATTFSASGIGSGTYYVRVRAQNAAGVSGPSNESILTVSVSACTSAPSAPDGLVTSATGSTVTLTWTAPTVGCAPTAYILQAGSAAGLSNLANSNTGNTATSYVALGVGAGTYYVRVLAANAYGQSAGSNEVVVTVGTSPGGNVTGRWVGLAPDGLVSPAPLCQAEADLTLDLTQTGSTVSGTATDRTRVTRCENNRGKTRPLTGTVGAGVVSFTIEDSGEGGNFNCSGTFTATRMTGSCGGSSETFRLTFAVNRQ